MRKLLRFTIRLATRLVIRCPTDVSNLVRGKKYWTEENVCWKIQSENACQLGSCEPGSWVCEPETSLKRAAGLLEVQLGYLEIRHILRYHKLVQKQGTGMAPRRLKRQKTIWKNKTLLW